MTNNNVFCNKIQIKKPKKPLNKSIYSHSKTINIILKFNNKLVINNKKKHQQDQHHLASATKNIKKNGISLN